MAAPHFAPWSVEAAENANGKSIQVIMDEAMGKTGTPGDEEDEEEDRKKKKKVKKKRKSIFDETQNKSLDDEVTA